MSSVQELRKLCLYLKEKNMNDRNRMNENYFVYIQNYDDKIFSKPLSEFLFEASKTGYVVNSIEKGFEKLIERQYFQGNLNKKIGDLKCSLSIGFIVKDNFELTNKIDELIFDDIMMIDVKYDSISPFDNKQVDFNDLKVEQSEKSIVRFSEFKKFLIEDGYELDLPENFGELKKQILKRNNPIFHIIAPIEKKNKCLSYSDYKNKKMRG